MKKLIIIAVLALIANTNVLAKMSDRVYDHFSKLETVINVDARMASVDIQ